jgi:uncharacterized protein (TIGR02677 family)
LLAAVATLNERRSGRSDRSADFRVLARWFADASGDAEAHRLWRAAFGLNPARHLSLESEAAMLPAHLPASTPWADAPAVAIHPRLREQGELTPRGPPPHVRDRGAERATLASYIAEERAQVDAARARLATGRPTRLSALDVLEPQAFRLFLTLLGEALVAQQRPGDAVECHSADGLMRIRLEPLAEHTVAHIATALGVFSGRDHILTITPVGEGA